MRRPRRPGEFKLDLPEAMQGELEAKLGAWLPELCVLPSPRAKLLTEAGSPGG